MVTFCYIEIRDEYNYKQILKNVLIICLEIYEGFLPLQTLRHYLLEIKFKNRSHKSNYSDNG